MKTSNANKVISVLMSVAMCPMMVPNAAFAADDDTTSDAPLSTELTPFFGQDEGTDTGASLGAASTASQSEATGKATGRTITLNENAPSAVAPGEEGATTDVAKVGETTYTTLEDAFAALNGTNRTLSLLNDSAWDAATPVYYKVGETSGYAAKLTDALTAAYKANAGDITIVCRPGSNLGAMTHGHVADNITIYGNSAYVSGGECDLEVDTYQFDRSTGQQPDGTPVTELADKTIEINAYDVKNLGVWGERHTNATVNVNLTNCDGRDLGAANAQRVYISGTSGENNITLTDCNFITANTAVYSNADGTVTVNSCSFTGSIVPVNFNHKAAGTQTVTVANSTFTNCGTTGDWAAFAAPARFVNSGTGTLSATINACSFKETAGANGDILIGDGRTGQESNEVALTVANTVAKVQAQKPGYYGKTGTEVADASLKGEVTTTAAEGLDGASIESIVTPAPAAVAEVAGKSYPSLQAAIDAAKERAVVKLLADTKENVTISTPRVTLDLNGHTLNGGTEKSKPALTVTALNVTVMDSSETQAGTIERKDTAENSGVSSHYVIDVQGKSSLFFKSGNVTNNSGTADGKGASLVRVGDDKKREFPKMFITGGTFTQENFIALKCDYGQLIVSGGTINSANSYAIQNWKSTIIRDAKDGTSSPAINGNVSTWTYKGSGSSLEISGGTVTGKVESVTYDGAAGKPAKVAISGGTVKGQLYTLGYNSSTGTSTEIKDPAKATIEVEGGTFSADPSQYVAGNFATTKNADGTYGVAKAQAQPIAQVGETKYNTMDEARDAQAKTGKAITLLRDYTTGSKFNSGNGDCVVDLNGYTWTYTGTDANSAAFEINYSNASLTVKNGNVVSSQLIGLISFVPGVSSDITYDNSKLTFEGVEATTKATSGIETNGNNTNDTVVLKNSKLNVPNGFGIYFPSSGTLTIDNSAINAKTMGAQVCSGNLNVTAGSAITVSGDPVEKLEGDGAIQDGAAISIVNRSGYKGLGKVAITGGTFTAKGDNAAIKAYTWDSATKQESAFDNSAKTVAVSGGTFSSAVASDLCAKGYAPVKNENGTYDVKEETRGTEANPYTLADVGAMTRAEYVAAQKALGGTMYVEVGNYTYDKNGVLGNGERNDTPGQNPDHSKLNAYGENGYLNEKNDGANGKNIVFVNGSITSGATGYTSIDNIGTSLLLAVPAYTNVTFKGIAFNNVMSFNYQLYTSPWSQLGELKFDGCTFNGIIVGAIAAQTLTFNGCKFENYTNATSANNSNPTWIRPAYGNWTAGDNKGQGDNFQSLTKINFTGNTVTSTRPVKFEYISQWDIRSKVTVTNNSFNISAQEGDTAIKNVGLYLGAHTKTNAFDLVADGNTKSGNTAALYTIPEGETSLPLGSTVTNTNGDQIELTDALKWKAANAAQDKIALKTVKAVASVDTVNFATLTEAINAAQDGQTVTLLADVEQNSQLTINKDITLDLNGKTIKNTVDIWGDNTNAILSIANGAKVTITGNGTMDAKENDCYTINVKKGDLTIENGTFYGNVSVVQVQEGTLSVKGGTFDLHQKWGGSSKYLFNCIDDAYAAGSANVAISGGTFAGFDPNVSPEQKVDGKAPSFAAPGVGITKNEDGSFTAAAGMTAQILDKDGNSVKAYSTLADAVAAAEDGQTVRLLADVELDGQIAAGKAITIDGQSKYTIKAATKIVGTNGKAGMFYRTTSAQGTLTFLNVTLDGNGVSKIFLNEGGAGETVFDGVTSNNGGGISYGSGIHISGGGSHATIRNSTLTGSTGTMELNETNYYAANDLWVGGNVYVTVENSVIGNVFVNSAPSATATNGVVHGQLTITGADTKITYLSGEEESTDKLDKFGNNGSLVKIDSGNVEAIFDKGSYAISGGTFKTGVKKEWCAAGYAPTANADGTYGVELAAGAYLLQEYRSGDQGSWTYPTQEGMAFAGWYKDAAFATPCTAEDVEGAAYAKFVNITDLLQFKGGSLRMDVTDPSTSTYLRFGYTMAVPKGVTYVENGWYIKSIDESAPEDVRHVASNKVLNNDGTVTSNLVIVDVPNTYYKYNFAEKAFVKYVTADGTTIEVVENAYQSRSVNEVADAILAHPMASQEEKDYATKIKSVIK